MPVIEQTAQLPASPSAVFAFLTDPDLRGEWDDGCSACTLLGDRPAAGARLQLPGPPDGAIVARESTNRTTRPAGPR